MQPTDVPKFLAMPNIFMAQFPKTKLAQHAKDPGVGTTGTCPQLAPASSSSLLAAAQINQHKALIALHPYGPFACTNSTFLTLKTINR